MLLLWGSRSRYALPSRAERTPGQDDASGCHHGVHRLFEESLALCRGTGDRIGIAGALSELAFVALDEDDPAAARPLLEESLRLRRECGDRVGAARMLLYLGHVARREADLPAARALYEESLALVKALEHTWVIASCRLSLGLVETAAGDYPRARALLAEARSTWQQAGDTRGVVRALRAFGRLAAAETPGSEGARRAAMLFGAAEALQEAAGLSPGLHELAGFERLPPAVRASLDDEAFEAAWAAGRTMTPEEAFPGQ
jgi:tetratricopeptide (TPR) repeat protein